MKATSKTLVVDSDRVLVHRYDDLDPPIKEAIGRVLAEHAVAPQFDASTLVVPRFVADRSIAPLLGRCLRPASRKADVLEELRARTVERSYPEPLDADAICRHGRAFAERIDGHREAVLRVLARYETRLVARDELARTWDLLSSLDENRGYFVRRIGDVATFLPCNQPLYALACFGLVPSLMARRVYVRPSDTMGGFFEELLGVLEVERWFPNLVVTRASRAEFLAERSAGGTDAVIFTGTHHNANDARKHFDERVLFIVNGSGHNPIVVTDTANVERAVASIVAVALYNQGQDCAAPNAVLVHARVYEALLARLRVAIADAERGPLTRRSHLEKVQAALVANARWLDPSTPGVIHTAPAIVEPALICRPLAEGGNFTEHFAPLVFVQRYDADAELARYFEDPRYALHAMYVTVFGDSPYVDALPGPILRDTDLHALGVERGTQPYGGYGPGASFVHLGGRTTPKPTLPQRDLFEQLVLPTLAEPPVPSPRSVCARRDLLDPAIAPVYRDDSVVEPLLDGAEYFAAIGSALGRTRGPGDAIYVLAYQLDPRWRIPGEPSGQSIAELLAEKAARGVDVRIVLNGTPSPINPWRENHAAARYLRGFASLARRVLVDRSGLRLLGSQHQKAVIVRSQRDVVAFASGMDLVGDHWDRAPHGAKSWPDGSAWGWHDVGVAVRGAAVRGVWNAFGERWTALDRALPIGPCPAEPVASDHAVQVLRSSIGRGRPAVHELADALKHAIARATRYIYIEDQFLCDHAAEHLGLPLPPAPVRIPPRFSLFADLARRLRACPTLRLVLVGSGKSDPIDFLPGPRNRRPTPSVKKLLAALPARDRDRVIVCAIPNTTVHSKLVLIDDELATIGSGNFRTRSLYGIDSELQIAVVAPAAVRRLRTRLWAELLGMLPIEAPLLDDIDRGLAYWERSTMRLR